MTIKVPLALPLRLRIALETLTPYPPAVVCPPPLTLATVGGAATAACGARTPMPVSVMIPSSDAKRRGCNHLGSNQIFGNYLRRSPSHREPAPARFSFNARLRTKHVQHAVTCHCVYPVCEPPGNCFSLATWISSGLLRMVTGCCCLVRCRRCCRSRQRRRVVATAGRTVFSPVISLWAS